MPKVRACASDIDHHDLLSGGPSHTASEGHTTRSFTPRPKADTALDGLKSRASSATKADAPGYIRTLQVVSRDALGHELDRHGQGVPVSATAIGTGPFKAFQQDKRSGLMLAADTPMVVGAKKDMGTNALIKDQDYQSVLSRSRSMPPAELSRHTRKTLEKYYLQDSDIGEIKRPHVFEDRARLTSKYQEMANRQNGTSPDKSSKYVLADALKQHVPEFSAATPVRPFSAYREQLKGKLTPEQHASIDHALPKLNSMSDAQQQAYLEAGRNGSGTSGYAGKPVLPHNENLLKPRPQDLQGIFVSPHEPEAALELQRQYASIHGGAELPFMTYDARSGTSQVITPDTVRKMIKT
ncbi:hypothetical protein [Burkholderia sp. GS2Y]|uniref:Uncharacterized protein n=1 Tax=Burkholderia theae TaxID=3143496 RepID=A0ABU9WEJ6_9BURK